MKNLDCETNTFLFPQDMKNACEEGINARANEKFGEQSDILKLSRSKAALHSLENTALTSHNHWHQVV